MKSPSVPLTPAMTAALAKLARAKAALLASGGTIEKDGGRGPRQSVAHREEDSGLRRAENGPPEGGGCGRTKRAE